MTDVVSVPSESDAPTGATPLVFGRPPLLWRTSTWVIIALCTVALVVAFFVFAAHGLASASGGCGGG